MVVAVVVLSLVLVAVVALSASDVLVPGAVVEGAAVKEDGRPRGAELDRLGLTAPSRRSRSCRRLRGCDQMDQAGDRPALVGAHRLVLTRRPPRPGQ